MCLRFRDDGSRYPDFYASPSAPEDLHGEHFSCNTKHGWIRAEWCDGGSRSQCLFYDEVCLLLSCEEERPDVSSSPSSSSSYHHHFNHQYYYHYHHHCHYHYNHCNCHCHYHYLHHRHVNEALSERAVASALVLIMASARVVQILGADVMAILRKASCHGPDSKLLHYREGRHSDPNARSPGKPWKMGLNYPALGIHYPTCGTHISWGMQALQ